MKPLALSGTDGGVVNAPFLKSSDYVRAIGKNSGNLVFQYAAHRVIGEPCQIIGRDLPYNMTQIRTTARAIVVPSSNFIREGADFSNYVSFLERTELPLVFLGLGAQATSFDQAEFDFHPSIHRFIDLAKERGGTISVRGKFTAELLDRFGITDVVVTGCPSNFINPNNDFAFAIAERWKAPADSFIAHLENPWDDNQGKSKLDRRLTEWVRHCRAIAVQQSVPPILEYLRHNNPASVKHPAEGFEASLQKQMMPDADPETFRDFCMTRLRTYCSVDQWMEDSARFDFSLGMRLHGNMAAWQVGVPSLWIHHDARTRELVEAMALPGISLTNFLDRCHSIEDAYNAVHFDAAGYVARRKDLRAALHTVLDAHGIKTVN